MKRVKATNGRNTHFNESYRRLHHGVVTNQLSFLFLEAESPTVGLVVTRSLRYHEESVLKATVKTSPLPSDSHLLGLVLSVPFLWPVLIKKCKTRDQIDVDVEILVLVTSLQLDGESRATLSHLGLVTSLITMTTNAHGTYLQNTRGVVNGNFHFGVFGED
jgi:hypothetical protein